MGKVTAGGLKVITAELEITDSVIFARGEERILVLDEGLSDEAAAEITALAG